MAETDKELAALRQLADAVRAFWNTSLYADCTGNSDDYGFDDYTAACEVRDEAQEDVFRKLAIVDDIQAGHLFDLTDLRHARPDR